MKPLSCYIAIGTLFLAPSFASAIKVQSEELSQAQKWAAEAFDRQAAKNHQIPFSFLYNGQSSMKLLSGWNHVQKTGKLDEARSQHTLIYTDPATGLQIRCEVVVYRDFPTVEWTLYFKNTSAVDTPLLENVQALDITLQRRMKDDEFLLYYNRGDFNSPTSYEPLTEVLDTRETVHFRPVGGRPTNEQFPFYNIHWNHQGRIIVIGWPGQWAADMQRDSKGKLRIRAGQELTRFLLHPGEEVRTPRIVIQFYQGDWLRGQNLWRRWMRTHNTPHPGGKELAPLLTSGISGQCPGMKCRLEEEIRAYERFQNANIQLDYWWIDAGWYICKKDWSDTGTWQVDMERYPGGLRAMSDLLHAKGCKLLVWFEPERINPGSWMSQNHPEWIFGGQTGWLLNMGDNDCRQWLTDFIDQLIVEQGIDLYRQDFNYNPLRDWRSHDEPDRQGINEIRNVEGYLAYWDELQKRHPDMLIDCCASGGRRIDIETLRRSVPLHRSDFTGGKGYNFQCHTYGLSLWLPYSGRSAMAGNDYEFRSTLAPAIQAVVDKNDAAFDFTPLRRQIEQWRQVAPLLLADYYPLTEYTLDYTQSMAWQFDDPESGKGLIQAFRRYKNIHDQSILLKPRALEPLANYLLTNLDTFDEIHRTGQELMETGLTVPLKNQPDSALILYRRK